VEKDNIYGDLHIHTNKSDGEYSVEDIFKMAREKEITIIAITDHDTVNGVEEALYFSKKYNIEFIPGVELSAMYNNLEVHIVGLYINWQDDKFKKILNYFQRKRAERAKKIVRKLKEHGIKIELDELFELQENINNIGRLHIAKLLVKKSYAKNVKDAFQKFLSEDRFAYVKKAKLDVEEAIKIIKEVKGISFLAHPALLNIDFMIKEWKEKGLDGIEAFHPDHSNEDVERYLKIGREYNMLISGGSDFHGTAREYSPIGYIKLPYRYIEKIKEYKRLSLIS